MKSRWMKTETRFLRETWFLSKSLIVIAVLIGACACAIARLPVTRAAPPAQATEEPTKPPYIFPTPIFIPTFPPESPTAAREPGAPTNTPLATRAPDSASGEQTYIIERGDSPWIIAQKVYGDGTKYKIILDANGLTTSSRLRVGSTLIIPPLEGTPRAPTATATLAATPTVAITPTPAPTITPTLVATLTPTSAPGMIPSSFGAPMVILVNVFSIVFFIAALITGVLALLAYERARRFMIAPESAGRLQRWLNRKK
ncbi:MAG: LysM peptidoglycan-binding domain-containing protein [Chloroflexi bacterium]|nr:LysM peptidoglycan-binding domain-containing protein [Chloroflexota bacterium]